MAKLAGKWNLVESDKFDEYMKAVGVGLVTRKMGNTIKPKQIIIVEGTKVTIKTESTFKSTEITCTLGEQFDETTADGRKVKATITSEGDSKFIHQQDADIPSTLIRELTDDETMTMTLTAKDVVCKRIYKRE